MNYSRKNTISQQKNDGQSYSLGITQSSGLDRHGILYHGRIRRLVPRECLRLQGYYDWQIDKIIDSTSDAQLYKQAGNGVTVNVIEAIGRLLQKADSELNTQKVSEKGIH